MSLNDPLANVLSMIKTYDSLGKRELYTKSNSGFIRKVLGLLQDNKYIGAIEEIEDGKGNILKVNLIGAVNDIGVIKPRFSLKRANYDKFEKRYLPAKNFGVIIVSTNKGILTHNQAKQQNLGGKLICYCY
ncbi:MAG: 30S ribosomal protein S8 [Nanoarchaeota archaeon]